MTRLNKASKSRRFSFTMLAAGAAVLPDPVVRGSRRGAPPLAPPMVHLVGIEPNQPHEGLITEQ